MGKLRDRGLLLIAMAAAMLLVGAQAAVAADDVTVLQPAPGHEQVAAPAGYVADGDSDQTAQAPQAQGSLSAQSITTQATSGSCGANATWSYANGTLTISGSGEMADYSSSEPAPWSSNAASIIKVVVKQGITRTGTQAFEGLSSLTSVTLPNSLKTVGEACFMDDAALTTIDMSSVTVVERGAFVDCTQLASVSAPNLTTLSEYAFQGTVLTTFQVGKNLTTISPLAFYKCKAGSFTVAAGNSAFKAKGGVLFSDGGKTLFLYPAGSKSTSYILPSGVTKVGDQAFCAADNLQSVKLDGAETLGSSAFQGCGITSLSIPDSVTSVGDYTFDECPNLQSVKFGKGLTSTGYGMFCGCTSLTTIDYGSLTSLDYFTFTNCLSLKDVTLPATITTVNNGCFAATYPGLSGLTTFTSLGLTEIPFQCFLNCNNLVTVNLNEGVKTINRGSFLGCDKLASIDVPKSCTLVYDYAFETTTNINCLDQRMKSYGQHGYRQMQNVRISGLRNYQKAFEVLTLVNQQRAAQGLSPLVMDQSLLESAMVRAGEQSVLFSHTRPDGSSAFTANDNMLAENVAYGQSTAQQVMDSWMQSDGHRGNILDKNSKVIGIGCFEIGGDVFWTQCFGETGDSSNCAKPDNKNVHQEMWLANGEFEDPVENNDVVFFDTGETYQFTFAPVLSSATLDVGQSAQATLYVGNGSASCPIIVPLDSYGFTWASSDQAIAMVTSEGSVAAKSKGTVNIVAQLAFQEQSVPLRVGAASVVRLAGNNRYDTMQAITGQGYDKADVVLIASGVNYADALAASGMCGVMNAPVLLTDPNKLSAQTASEIARLKPTKAYILGGTSAVSSSVEKAVKARVGNVQRIGGSTRLETALNIYKTTIKDGGTWGDTCIVAKGWSYADALSAGSMAYVNHMPIFMANDRGWFSDEVLEAISHFDNVIALGGTSGLDAISDYSLHDLSDSTLRLSGDTRYETAVAIATWATGNSKDASIQPDHPLSWNNMAFAYAGNFPDALAGVNVTGPSKSVTVLVSTNIDQLSTDVLAKTAGLYSAQITRAYVIGGTSVVSDSVKGLIAAALK